MKNVHLLECSAQHVSVSSEAAFWSFVDFYPNFYKTMCFLQCTQSTMVDKIPWDTCVISLIFGVFKTEFYKGSYAFQNALLPPPPSLPIQCWNSGEIACTCVKHCSGVGVGWKEGLNKCRWIRVKKRHKCKFVPRLLSMIVGIIRIHPWFGALRLQY